MKIIAIMAATAIMQAPAPDACKVASAAYNAALKDVFKAFQTQSQCAETGASCTTEAEAVKAAQDRVNALSATVRRDCSTR